MAGLVIAGVNSLVVCVIGLHTSQYGFVPANLFCICINAFNLRAWLKMQKNSSESRTDAGSELLTRTHAAILSKEGMGVVSSGVVGSTERAMVVIKSLIPWAWAAE